MFGKKMPAQAPLPPAGAAPRLEKQRATLIAKSAVFTGDIDIEGDIHIWGKITGNIRVKEGAIHVMHAGQVDGELLAPEIIIDGKVDGTCCATTLDILEHGELHGVSRCAGMTIQRGGQFVGQSESGEPLSLQSGTKDPLSRRRGASHDRGAEHRDGSGSVNDERSGGTHASSSVRQDRRAREDRPTVSPVSATHDGKATVD